VKRPRADIPWIEIAASLAGEKLGLPLEHRKLMTAHQVMSLTHVDHWPILHVHGGPDVHWNLDVIPIMDHREKTVRDVKALAKTRRIHKRRAERQLEHAARYHAEAQTPEPLPRQRARPKRKIPSRGFSKQHRPMRKSS
jgi:hypothetical protein